MANLMHHPDDLDADRDYVVVVTHLEVRGLRTAIRFFRSLRPVQAQMRRSEGLLAWGLHARILTLRFGTYSVFTSRRSVAEFVGSGAHGEAMARLRGRLAHADTVTTTMKGRDLPRGWTEIYALLDDHTRIATRDAA